MKVWLPAIRGNSGTDVFTRRLHTGLQRHGIDAEITWFSKAYQWLPQALSWTSAPPGTDIIHANAWHGLAFRRTQPLVLTEHQGVFGHRERCYRGRAQEIYHTQLMRRYLWRSLALADTVIAVSDHVAQGLQRTVGFSGGRVIPNFIDTDRFCPGPARPDGTPFRLLFVGNFAPLKGAEVLRTLMPRLGPAFELRFTSGLKGLRTGPLPENMRCIGRINDEERLIAAYHDCDAVIAPSYFEGFGYTALEGMACGKPVIASHAGALPEVVADGTTGLLCKPGDVDAFATACRDLAENQRRAQQMGEAGRQRAVEHFSERSAIPRYLAVYQACLSGSGQPPGP